MFTSTSEIEAVIFLFAFVMAFVFIIFPMVSDSEAFTLNYSLSQELNDLKKEYINKIEHGIKLEFNTERYEMFYRTKLDIKEWIDEEENSLEPNKDLLKIYYSKEYAIEEKLSECLNEGVLI